MLRYRLDTTLCIRVLRDRNLHGMPLRLGNKTYSRGVSIHSRTFLRYRLAGDYSRFHNVTFGVVVGFEGNLIGPDDTEKGFRIGGRAGYVVPLTDTAALWPRVGITFGNTTFQSATEEYTVSSTRLTTSLPVMFTPYPQVLVGIAPTFEHDLRATTGNEADTRIPKVTGYGIHLMFGFWFE